MRPVSVYATLLGVLAACSMPRSGVELAARCPGGWRTSHNADSTISACVPPGFRLAADATPYDARWERSVQQAGAWLAVRIDTTRTSDDWPPRLRATSPCTADCITVDSVVPHEDSVGASVAHVETGLLNGGFAGFHRRPNLVGGWEQPEGGVRVRVNGSAGMGATLDTLRTVIRTVRVRPPRRTASVDWPVYGGSSDNTHYSTLDQITPANVARLKVAWTYDTHDAFKGSEMQANPIVIDGILYATSPKLRVFALDAATGRELWSFDPNYGKPAPTRFRHRGLVVTGDRVLVTYRHKLYALDRRTGQPIVSFGDSSGFTDMRNAFDRPADRITVSASSPGAVFEGLYIIGSSVPEALPSSPGDIRAYDVKTGALRWVFHTIPRPGEFGYDTWPPDAWKVAGGANAWSGVTVDQRRGIVFAATGSASFDFYGANRIGDNLFANTVLALDARTGKRLWHFQAIRHDLWDWDFPAAPALVTVQRDGRPIDAVAQITKTGYVYLFERVTGRPLFPIAYRRTPPSTMDGEQAADSQPYPVAPPPFVRQTLTEDMLTRRTPAAHDSVVKFFRAYRTSGMYDPPNTRGTIIFPGVDGGGEWGGPAFDPASGLLYVNANEMPWYHRLIENSDKSLFGAQCATCHGDNLQGSASGPSLVGVGTRKSRDEIAQIIRQGTGRMPGFGGGVLDNTAINSLAEYLATGKDVKEQAGINPTYLKYRSSGLQIFLDPGGYPPITPPWGTLNAIDLNRGEIRWSVPFGEYPALAAQGLTNTGSDSYGGPVVTANGLLFIGASTYDRKFRVYDKRTGTLLWETLLPASGNATPSLYMVDGKQYVVIACGGGKNDAPSGGTYVAFAIK